MKVFRISDAIETGDAGNHNHIPPSGHQGRRCAQTKFLDFVIDAQILFYIGVGRGNICLRLVVVVVGDEVFDGIVRNERLELSVELGGEGLVVAENERRPLESFNHVSHRECLSRPRYT